MTILKENNTATDETNEFEGITLHNEEQYLSSSKVKLNHKWQYDLDIEAFLRDLPKVELHVHLDGSFDPELLYSYLESSPDAYNRIPIDAHCPWDDSTIPIKSAIEQCQHSQDLHSLCTCRGKRSLHEMIKCFEHFIPIVRGNLILIERLAYDFVKRQSVQNVIYTEVRYSPHLLAEGGDYTGTEKVDAVPVIDAVTKGLRRGEKDFGVKVNQILCCIAWRPDFAKDVIELANDRRNNIPCAIVGVDIAAGEEHFDKINYPQLDHEDAFQKAKDLNLNITIHAGEVGDAAFVERSVNNYGAIRIGHGYRVVLNERLMDELKERNIHFEVCPTSSLETGGWDYKEDEGKDWKKHPAVRMFKHGLSVGFNSDDPAVFDTSLTWQYRLAIGKMGLSKKCIIKSIYNSIDAAFVSINEKQAMKKILRDYLDTAL